MGKGSAREQQARENTAYQQNQAAITTASAPTAAELWRDMQLKQRTDYVNAGDYTKAAPGAVTSLGLAAVNQRKRNEALNAPALNNAALGGGGQATVLALNRQYLDNKAEQESAFAYQNEIKGYVDDTYNMANGAIQSDNSKHLGVAGLTNQAYSTQLNRPRETPWWQAALGGAAGVGASYFSGGFAGRK